MKTTQRYLHRYLTAAHLAWRKKPIDKIKQATRRIAVATRTHWRLGLSVALVSTIALGGLAFFRPKPPQRMTQPMTFGPLQDPAPLNETVPPSLQGMEARTKPNLDRLVEEICQGRFDGEIWEHNLTEDEVHEVAIRLLDMEGEP